LFFVGTEDFILHRAQYYREWQSLSFQVHDM